jgi:hypothetical protein
MDLADSARTTQLLQAAFNVVDTTLAGHGYRENGFKDWQSHDVCFWEGCNLVRQTRCGISRFGRVHGPL